MNEKRKKIFNIIRLISLFLGLLLGVLYIFIVDNELIIIISLLFMSVELTLSIPESYLTWKKEVEKYDTYLNYESSILFGLVVCAPLTFICFIYLLYHFFID